MKGKIIALTAAGALALAGSASAGTSQAQGLTLFHTPSKNIRCAVGTMPGYSKLVACQTANNHRTVKLFHGFRAEKGSSADLLPLYGASRVISYGNSIHRAGFTCHSTFDGLECGDRLGHGFWINRDRIDTW
jgi:hypothetical protein